MNIKETESKYSRIFDRRCIGWSENRDDNLVFLRQTELYYNDCLRRKGYVFLRDIFETLGIQVTRDSLIVGWVYKGDNRIRDNYISFGINYAEESKEADIVLDFNVDGDIRNYFN